MKLAVIGSTNGTDMQAIIDAKIPIELVISNKEDAGILAKAKKANIPAVFIDSRSKEREDFDMEVMEVLEKYNIDMIILIGYMRFLSKSFVDKYEKKIMNIHPSLLPKYAGGMDLNVHEEVLKNNETETGCTLHWVDEGADTGEIIGQKKVKIEPGETPDTLKAKVQKAEGELIVETLKKFSN
ncbi:MAG: phosphoribosylglycinamide formyltransferase [Patescibacteria group bacterium]